jgi:hypothetical protein
LTLELCGLVFPTGSSGRLHARQHPPKHRSKVIAGLLEHEIKRREEAIYRCALKVESDEALHEEMKDWEVTQGDGIEDESW